MKEVRVCCRVYEEGRGCACAWLWLRMASVGRGMEKTLPLVALIRPSDQARWEGLPPPPPPRLPGRGELPGPPPAAARPAPQQALRRQTPARHSHSPFYGGLPLAPHQTTPPRRPRGVGAVREGGSGGWEGGGGGGGCAHLCELCTLQRPGRGRGGEGGKGSGGGEGGDAKRVCRRLSPLLCIPPPPQRSPGCTQKKIPPASPYRLSPHHRRHVSGRATARRVGRRGGARRQPGRCGGQGGPGSRPPRAGWPAPLRSGNPLLPLPPAGPSMTGSHRPRVQVALESERGDPAVGLWGIEVHLEPWGAS